MRPTLSLRPLLLALALTPLALPLSLAQAPTPTSAPYTPTLTFDVISVRESIPDPQEAFIVGGDFAGKSSSLSLSNADIQNLLSHAYGVSSHQVQGLPDWASRPMYNVQAKSDEAADVKLASLPKQQLLLEHQHMLQTLLADRFSLKAHWETRDAPIYELVVAKGGPRLQPGGSLPPSAQERTAFGDRPIPAIHQRGNGIQGYEFLGHECHIASLTPFLGMIMATDVIDKTGLTATYDFDLKYSQRSEDERQQDPAIWPPIPDALDQQLGLKLQSAKGPIKMLVIDHIERPSAN